MKNLMNKTVLALALVLVLVGVVPQHVDASSTGLTDGNYTVEVKMLKANNNSNSMAGDYFGKRAAIKVDQNGTNMALTFIDGGWFNKISNVKVNAFGTGFVAVSKNDLNQYDFGTPELTDNTEIRVQMTVQPFIWFSKDVEFRVIPVMSTLQ